MLEHIWNPVERKRIQMFRVLAEEYQRELGIDLKFQGFQEEMDKLPGAYAPPSGAMLLLAQGDRWVGCGAIRPLEPGICEIKRMYLRPGWRGQGFGAEILESLLVRAKEIGHHSVRLDTLRRLEPALSLYQRYGFTEVAAYNFNPEPDIVYMERAL